MCHALIEKKKNIITTRKLIQLLQIQNTGLLFSLMVIHLIELHLFTKIDFSFCHLQVERTLEFRISMEYRSGLACSTLINFLKSVDDPFNLI